MNYKQGVQKAIAVMNEDHVTVDTLKEAVEMMNEDLSIDVEAFELALHCLESRTTPQEFMDFCETL